LCVTDCAVMTVPKTTLFSGWCWWWWQNGNCYFMQPDPRDHDDANDNVYACVWRVLKKIRTILKDMQKCLHNNSGNSVVDWWEEKRLLLGYRSHRPVHSDYSTEHRRLDFQ
jgi:hypothetical protein